MFAKGGLTNECISAISPMHNEKTTLYNREVLSLIGEEAKGSVLLMTNGRLEYDTWIDKDRDVFSSLKFEYRHSIRARSLSE